MRLSTLLSEYLNKRQRLKSSTLDWTKQGWRQFIEALGDMQAEEIRYADIEDFESALYSRGLRQNAVRSYLKAVSCVFGWAEYRELIESNPFDKYRLPKYQEGEIHIYTQTELNDIIAVAPDERWRAILMTTISTALRRSELLNLTVYDIDFDKETIKVQNKRETDSIWEYTTKNYQRRIVPLTSQASKLLIGLLTELPTKQPYIFLTERRYFNLQKLRKAGKMTDRQRLNPDDTITPGFVRIREAAGIRQGTFHDLRRTTITRWTQILAPQEVKKLAGHSEIETTMRYYAAVRDDVLDRARNIGATRFERASLPAPSRTLYQIELRPDSINTVK